MHQSEKSEFDIIREILDEVALPKEGDFCGEILEVGPLSITKMSGTSYVRVKVGLGSNQSVHCFIAGHQPLMLLATYALPKMVGERVKVRIKYMRYRGRTIADGQILEYLGI